MEEAPDDQHEEPEEPEPVAPSAEPEPAKVCKPVKKDLKEKVQCPGCSRWMSAHTLAYQHRCRAQTVAQASAPAPEVPAPEVPEPKKRLRLEKLPPPEKPVKMKSIIKKQERETSRALAPEAHGGDLRMPPPQPPPVDIYQAMILNRQEQARRHHEAMLAPYQQMFSLRR